MSHKKYLYNYLIIAVLILIAMQSCEKKSICNTNSWKRTKQERLLTDKYLDIADSLNKVLDYKNAYFYYNKAKTEAESKKDTSRVIYSSIEIIKMHLNQSDYIESESVATETLKLLEHKKTHYYNSLLYVLLGNIYSNIYDYKNAMLYYDLALKFKKTIPLNIILIKNNIANIYIEKKEFNKAAVILQPLILKKELIQDQGQYARVISNLGYCYLNLKSPKAKFYLEKALLIRTQINDNNINQSEFNLAKYYALQDIQKAKQYALSAYNSSIKINNKEDQLSSLKLLIKLNAGEKLKEYILKYISINDSLTKGRQIAKNQFAKIKYDSKTEKEENLVLKSQKVETLYELERQKNKNFILIFLSLMGIISTYFLYRYWKLKNRKEKIFTTYETETRISKRLHDELANDVYNTMTFAETQNLSKVDKKEHLLNQIEKIYNRTRNISLENSEIDTRENFKENLIVLISGFKNDKINIIIKNQDLIDWNIVKKSSKITIYRVIQELLVNMKKHSQCTLVVIGFESTEKTYEISYSDNGIGSPKALKFNNGLNNVENRIKTIDGIFTFDTELNKGFKAKIIFPH